MIKDVQRPPTDQEKLAALIKEVDSSGGAEISNFQPFIMRLCEALHLPNPDFATEDRVGNDYCFERRVDHTFEDGRTTTRRIDLYKRGCFIMEAKQSARRQKVDPQQIEMLGDEAARQTKGQARRGSAKWDRVMQAARNQAIDYARDLPVEHGYPPFIMVIDVGNVIEVYADFSGQGKNYSHFPDRQSYRISLHDLLDTDIQDRLWQIWQTPQSLDPARISAEVTKDIAQRLAKVARTLEKKHPPQSVAEFLMRCLFTMFAEDVDLIPHRSFETLLGELKDTPDRFVPALEGLWKNMDTGSPIDPWIRHPVRRFNGTLFREAKALPLEKEAIHELHVAAMRDWREVEPAIFGTMLEQALDARERSKLGAHFTPRAYVERLVIPTIIEPLRDDWADVQARAAELEDEGDSRGALNVFKEFHHQLCTTRVLDPACGTGNFLYVSFELMKRLEGDVLEALEAYPGSQASLAMEGETISPRQFYGLELNRRAVPIADLVLWIGYLKWQLRTGGPDSITEPVLHAYGNIRWQDAILAYDDKELRRDEQGQPITIWDGRTKKLHPVTGEDVPDDTARIETYNYKNPRRADWPEAEFIVGNPPFIGGKDMREELGGGYAEAAWKVRKDVPGGADFVMHFWDEAARRLTRKRIEEIDYFPYGAIADRPIADNRTVMIRPNPLRRFGFITTNSITQTFSRRVIEKWMAAKDPLSLVFAVPDHPWLKSADKAAVRIAMTTAIRGQSEGVLAEVVKEEGLNTDTPSISIQRNSGSIKAKLNVGANLSELVSLFANELIAIKGFELGTQGLVVSQITASRLQHKSEKIRNIIRPYYNGNDLKNGRSDRFAIDTYPRSWSDLNEFPELTTYLLDNVLGTRNPNTDDYVAQKWWQFRRTGAAIRGPIEGAAFFIATTRTAKHRFFTALPAETIAESKTVIIALERMDILGILSGRVHIIFANETGGWQGVGNDPVYQHTDTFEPYPFPACVTDPEADNSRLDELGERLDAFRKERLEEWDWLTMTRLYNALERYREAMNDGDPFTEEERTIHERAQIAILAEIHDDIDRAVLDAYGWSDLAPALIGKPGGTTPSPHKSPEHEEAEEELLSRLVALNRERAEEEARGHVRWLRPDYQIPKLGHKVPQADEAEQAEADLVLDQGPDKPSWPKDGLEQIRLVRDVLSAARGPVDAETVARAFKQRLTPKRQSRVEDVLENLTELGLARAEDGGYIAAR